MTVGTQQLPPEQHAKAIARYIAEVTARRPDLPQLLIDHLRQCRTQQEAKLLVKDYLQRNGVGRDMRYRKKPR